MSERRTTEIAVEVEYAASATVRRASALALQVETENTTVTRRTSAVALQVETHAIVIPRRVTLVALQVEYTPPPPAHDGHGTPNSTSYHPSPSPVAIERTSASGQRSTKVGEGAPSTLTQAVIYGRDGSFLRSLPPDAKYEAGLYLWSSVGGPEKTEVRVTTNRTDVWQYLNCLRCPIEIITEGKGAEAVWWGYIDSVKLRVGRTEATISLDGMANAVRATYVDTVPGAEGRGERKTTAWAEDADSIAEYGRKELQISVSAVDQDSAEYERDEELRQRKLPIPDINPFASFTAVPTVTLVCKSWLETLRWRTYSQDAGKVEHKATDLKRLLFGWQRSGSELGFDSGRRRIYDAGAGFALLKANDAVIVSGSTSNNATFMVEAVGGHTPAALLSSVSGISFESSFTVTSEEGTAGLNHAINEAITAVINTAVNLAHQNLHLSGVVVTNSAGSTTYVENTDYQIAYSTGTITALIGGAITASQALKVSYYWYDQVTGEDVTARHNRWVSLRHEAVAPASQPASIVVTNATGLTTYTINTDYQVSRIDGRIKVLSTGAITNGQALKVSYFYRPVTSLQHGGIKASSVVVTNSAGSTTYVENTDYEIGYFSGVLAVVIGGAITDDQPLRITYHWYDYVEDEEIEAELGFWVELANQHVAPSGYTDSIIVMSTAGTTIYVLNTDYQLDRGRGRIKALGSGAITDGQTLLVSYFYAQGLIKDAAGDLNRFTVGDMLHVEDSASNDGWYVVTAVEASGTMLEVQENITDEAAGASVTLTAGMWMRVAEGVTDETPGASVTLKSAAQQVAQRFVSSADPAWTAANVLLNLQPLGDPGDAVTVELRSDSAGVPGTLLDSGSMPGSEMDGDALLEWVIGFAGRDQEIATGTNYWIVVKRSSASDYEAAYALGIDEATGYTDGYARVYNGSSWVARTPDADLAFRVGGIWSITRQIEQLIVSVGDMFDGVDIEDESTIFTSPWRNGDSNGYAELVAMLKKGNGSNLQLLCTVTRDRRLRVYREPDDTDNAAYWIDGDGALSRFYGGVPVDLFFCPVAFWLRLLNIVPPGANLHAIADPSHAFVERASYDPATGEWRPEQYRRKLNPFQIGRIRPE